MFRRLIVCKIIVFFSLILLLITGCSQLEQKDEIVIGVAWPFERLDSLFEKGIDLAVEEINSSGGINGKQLSLLKRDDNSELEKGMAIAQSFADNSSVQAVIGHANSFISLPASTIYNNAGLVMMSPASTAPALTSNNYQNTFRIIPSDDEIAHQLATYLSNKGYSRMVIYHSDDSYGSGLADSFEKHANSLGIVIVDRVNYYTSLEHLRRLHIRWQAFGFDGIFIARTMPEGGQFIFNARQAGINVPFIAGNGLDNPLLSEIGGPEAEGTIVGSLFNPHRELYETEKFVQTFLKKYKEMPSTYAALGYDAVKILAAAMEKSDLNNRATLAQELRVIGSWSGVAGIHQFDEKGENTGDLVVLKRLQNGKFTYLEK